MALKANERGLVPLKLKKNVPPVNAGEIAGFKPDVAEKLVAMGAAVPVEVKPEEKK